jgi:hypothetical protein
MARLALLLLLPVYAWAAEPAIFRFSSPTRIATASCTDFAWVSDLPLCLETARLLQLAGTEKFGLSPDKVEAWANGSSEDFLGWLKALEEKGAPNATMILYFVTHQLKDGSMKFSKGSDLAAADLIEAINRLARRYDRVVFINDSCYGAVLETRGKFYDNVVRLYAASDEEEACNLRFGKGPYGLEKFLKNERTYLAGDMKWEPPGMTFLGIIGLKAALEMAANPGSSVDLQTFFRRMSAMRNEYDESIRQKKVQHLILVPSTANFDLLDRKDHDP